MDENCVQNDFFMVMNFLVFYSFANWGRNGGEGMCAWTCHPFLLITLKEKGMQKSSCLTENTNGFYMDDLSYNIISSLGTASECDSLVFYGSEAI